MKLKVIISMDNSAFEPDAGYELGRLLGKVAVDVAGKDRFHLCGYERKLLDSNGNSVGKATVVQ